MRGKRDRGNVFGLNITLKLYGNMHSWQRTRNGPSLKQLGLGFGFRFWINPTPYENQGEGGSQFSAGKQAPLARDSRLKAILAQIPVIVTEKERVSNPVIQQQRE